MLIYVIIKIVILLYFQTYLLVFWIERDISMKKKFSFNPNWLTYLALVVLVFSVFFHFTGQLELNVLSLCVASILFVLECILFLAIRGTFDVGSLLIAVLAILCAGYIMLTTSF